MTQHFNIHLLKRFTASMLITILATQALTVFANPTVPLPPAMPELIPTVIYQGLPLVDGAVLPMDARVEVLYEFSADSNLLNISSVPLTLPQPLAAAETAPIEITANDGTNTFNAGAVTFGTNGDITLVFDSSALKQTNSAKPPLTEEPPTENAAIEPPVNNEPTPNKENESIVINGSVVQKDNNAS
ncbi:MAG: hypothetical protein RR205_01195, partial [Oscillospiraceae bacterium]